MPCKILVADDTPALLRLVGRVLRAGGFDVVAASDGCDALALAETESPDLVLADAVMPGIDGHTLCRVLKRKASTRRIPVIIMSGELTGEDDVVSGLDGGAEDYLAKPFPMDELLARIRAVLRRSGEDAPLERMM